MTPTPVNPAGFTKLESPYYFGMWRGEGMYLWNRFGSRLYPQHIPDEYPEELRPGQVEGRFSPTHKKDGSHFDEGQAAVHHVAGHTVLAFWDMTELKQSHGESIFIMEGTLNATNALERARTFFPLVFNRFPFEIKVVHEPS